VITGQSIGAEISSHLARLDGRLSFDALDMKSVAADIGNWFGVKVAIADSTLANRRITAMFNKPSLPEVLNAIAETTGSRYDTKAGGSVHVLFHVGRERGSRLLELAFDLRVGVTSGE